MLGSLFITINVLTAQPGVVNQRTLKDQTALMLAVSRDHLACAEYLLETGADPDITNKDRETPLYKGNIFTFTRMNIFALPFV